MPRVPDLRPTGLSSKLVVSKTRPWEERGSGVQLPWAETLAPPLISYVALEKSFNQFFSEQNSASYEEQVCPHIVGVLSMICHLKIQTQVSWVLEHWPL